MKIGDKHNLILIDLKLYSRWRGGWPQSDVGRVFNFELDNFAIQRREWTLCMQPILELKTRPKFHPFSLVNVTENVKKPTRNPDSSIYLLIALICCSQVRWCEGERGQARWPPNRECRPKPRRRCGPRSMPPLTCRNRKADPRRWADNSCDKEDSKVFSVEEKRNNLNSDFCKTVSIYFQEFLMNLL